MWRFAAMAVVSSCLAAPAYAADAPTSATLSAASLAAAAFVSPPLHSDEIAGDAAGHAFAPEAATRGWRSEEVQLSARTTGALSLRISTTEPNFAEERPLRLLGLADPRPAYEVSVVRDWRALAFEGRSFGLDFTPHAGLGLSNLGGVAEAGATVRLSQKRDDEAVERLKQLGIRDGADMGAKGRWYVFAAASGRAVGLNMMRGDGGWNRGGWTTDAASKLVGDAQLGVGWRKGPMQTSVGFIHREVKNNHLLFGETTKPDSLLAFSFSVRQRP